MVYIIQCLVSSSKTCSKDKLEEYRQDFMKQINEGCLLLPGFFKLVEVVKTDTNPIAYDCPDDVSAVDLITKEELK